MCGITSLALHSTDSLGKPELQCKVIVWILSSYSNGKAWPLLSVVCEERKDILLLVREEGEGKEKETTNLK